MKRCSKCQNEQELTAFAKKRASSDGYKSHCKVCDKTLREENKERDRLLKHEWYLRNKERHQQTCKQYDVLHHEEMKEWKRNYKLAYEKQRYKKDLFHRLKCILRSRLYQALKEEQKTGSAVSDLGCSIKEFKKYLESQFRLGMTWDNQGDWHIDHVRPLSSFNLSNPDEVKQACHYSNLQPLWAEENLQKSDKCA